MGHMNTRFYMAAFDDAGMHFFSAIGFDFSKVNAGNFGMADVRVEVDLKSEIPLGGLFRITSETLKIGNSSIKVRHELISDFGDTIHAVAQVTTVHLDLNSRRSAPLPKTLQDEAENYLRISGNN